MQTEKDITLYADDTAIFNSGSREEVAKSSKECKTLCYKTAKIQMTSTFKYTEKEYTLVE